MLAILNLECQLLVQNQFDMAVNEKQTLVTQKPADMYKQDKAGFYFSKI